MTDFSKFVVTPDAIRDFFEKNDFSAHLKGLDMKAADPKALLEAQKKNMDALVAANVAAANGFQELFRKQVEIFEETISEARDQVATLTSNLPDSKKAETQAELMKAAFQKALGNMQELAETAKKANEEAYGAISGRVEESIAELKDMMTKIKT